MIPKLGRFMSADPLIQSPGNLQSYNRYSYVWNNPLGSIDPSGLMSECTQDNCTSRVARIKDGVRVPLLVLDGRTSFEYLNALVAKRAVRGARIIAAVHRRLATGISTYRSEQNLKISNALTSVEFEVGTESFASVFSGSGLSVTINGVELDLGGNSGLNCIAAGCQVPGVIYLDGEPSAGMGHVGGAQEGCQVPLACAGGGESALALGVASALLPYAEGSVGVLRNGDVRYYLRGSGGFFYGNQYVATSLIRTRAAAGTLGPLGFAVGSVSDYNALQSGQISSGVATINLLGGAVGLIPGYAPVGIASGINSVFGQDVGAAVLGAAINAGPRPSIPHPDSHRALQRSIDFAFD